MREILFRGKRRDNGEWVVGHPFSQVYFPDTIEEDWLWFIKPIGSRSIGCSVTVDPSTVGQYTGLTDKNGKKVFEGDILHFWSEYNEAYMQKCVVKYGKFNCSCCDGVYGWYLDGGDIRYLDDKTLYEVCGNIHDNPELLEVEHEHW